MRLQTPLSLADIREVLFGLQSHLAHHAARAGEEEAERLEDVAEHLDDALEEVERVMCRPLKREAASLGTQLGFGY